VLSFILVFFFWSASLRLMQSNPFLFSRLPFSAFLPDIARWARPFFSPSPLRFPHSNPAFHSLGPIDSCLSLSDEPPPATVTVALRVSLSVLRVFFVRRLSNLRIFWVFSIYPGFHAVGGVSIPLALPVLSPLPKLCPIGVSEQSLPFFLFFLHMGRLSWKIEVLPAWSGFVRSPEGHPPPLLRRLSFPPLHSPPVLWASKHMYQIRTCP